MMGELNLKVHRQSALATSEDLKSDYLKSGNIWNLDFLKVGLQMVWFSNGQTLDMAIAPNF